MWSWEISQTNTLRDILQTSLESSQMAINPPWVCVPRGRRVGWSWDTRETRSSWASVACPLQSSAHLWPEHNRLRKQTHCRITPKASKAESSCNAPPWEMVEATLLLPLPFPVLLAPLCDDFFLGKPLAQEFSSLGLLLGNLSKVGTPQPNRDFSVCPQELLLRPYSKFDTLATLLGADLL